MRWLMAAVHTAEYKDLTRAGDIPLVHAPGLIETHCPSCHQLYFADVPYEESEPWDAEAQEWDAEEQLRAECPDHRHRFTTS